MVDHTLLLYWLDFPVAASIIDSGISNTTLLLTCLLVMNSIRYYVAKGRNEWGFDLVIAAAIEQAGNFRVPGISIAYGPTPAL